MAGYMIATVRGINNVEKLQAYSKAAGPTVQQHGGVPVITPMSNIDFVEGAAGKSMMVFRFPSYEQAVAWYNSPEYQEAKALRLGAVEADVVLVEGTD